MSRLLIAVSCCLSLSVSACSDDTSALAEPPPPTPSSSPPTSSPSSQRETPEDFVRRWVAADTHMQNTGDGAEYREMSAKCKNCLAYADYVEGIWKAGGHVKTKGWAITAARTSKVTSQGLVDVTITVDSAPTEFVEKSGGQIQHHAGGHVNFIITLVKAETSWSIFSTAQVAS